MSSVERASLLSIPCELRNAIYSYVFETETTAETNSIPAKADELAIALQLQDPARHAAAYRNARRIHQQLRVLQTCKQIYHEAHLLALSATPFVVDGEYAYPDVFDIRSRPLSPAKLNAIRHVTISARTSKLRALNEAWCGIPFGHPSLQLDTLTIVPNRAECHIRSMGEIADLSQSHTLAYILSETLKSLRSVKCVEVRNDGCFNEVVWRLFYRSFVYRLWRWGGAQCGIRFESGEHRPGGTAIKENQWLRAYMTEDDHRGFECGQEVCRLVGQTGELPDPNPAGVGP